MEDNKKKIAIVALVVFTVFAIAAITVIIYLNTKLNVKETNFEIYRKTIFECISLVRSI